MATPSEPDSHPPPPDTRDDARAFAHTTGFVFQAIGLVLLLGGCCVFSLSGRLQAPADQPIGSFREWLTVVSVPQIVGALEVLLSFTGGAALLTVGIGLQGDRPSIGRDAVVATAVFAVCWWAGLVAQVLFGGTWWQIVMSLVFAAVATLLFLLAGAGAQTLRRHAPLADADILPPELEPPTDAERVQRALDELDGTRGDV